MIGKSLFILSVAVIGIAYYCSRPQYGETVRTKSGAVRGVIKTSRDGREFYSWYGIPYAKPPVNELRFQDPQPVVPWDGIRDGSKYGPMCPQTSFFTGFSTGNEDCLHLNVHTPKLGDGGLEDQRKLPVIVYIHGGAYILGSSETAFPDYFMDEDVILVTINYRLGILGFLTTGDKVVRGNMGLKDQTTALKWIQENIENFGGDPAKVTIFGTSAGGASVHQQTLSKLSKGLFQRAISQSGAATNQWGFIAREQSLENLRKVAAELQCPAGSSEQLVGCMRGKTAAELVAAEEKLFNHKLSLFSPQLDGLGFVPTIEAVNDEKAFIAEHPLKIVSSGKAHGVPHLMGHTTGEGIVSTTDFRHDPGNLAKFESEWESRIRQLFQLTPDTPTDTVRKILEIYFPSGFQSESAVEERIQNYTALFGDAFFNFDIRETAKLQRKFSPVYYYLYAKTDGPSVYPLIFYEAPTTWPRAVRFTYSVAKYFIRTKLFGYAPLNFGADHAIDMFMHFPIPIVAYLHKGDGNYQFSKEHVRMVVDFANDDTSVNVRGTKLEPLAKEGPLYVLKIDDRTEIIREAFEDRMKILSSLDIRDVNSQK